MSQKRDLQAALAAVQAARLDSGVQSVVKLLDIMYEQAKEEMVQGIPEQLNELRVKAITIDFIRNRISRPSLTETQAQYVTKE